jgi:hypothetical protein
LAGGVVIGVKVDHTIDSGPGPEQEQGFRPILRYTTETGEVRQFVSETGQVGSESPYRMGTHFPVFYDPDDVLPPQIDSWFALWGTNLILMGVVGLVFIGCGALTFLAFGQRVLHGQ